MPQRCIFASIPRKLAKGLPADRFPKPKRLFSSSKHHFNAHHAATEEHRDPSKTGAEQEWLFTVSRGECNIVKQ